MSVAPLHRLYNHFSELPLSMRILYTGALCILGMGYLFALFYLVHVYAGATESRVFLTRIWSSPMPAAARARRLEAALRGPMSTMLPAEEASALVNWAQKGADRATYETFIRPTIDKRCMTCHDGSNPHLDQTWAATTTSRK